MATVTCSSCFAEQTVPRTKIGNLIRCRSCDAVFVASRVELTRDDSSRADDERAAPSRSNDRRDYDESRPRRRSVDRKYDDDYDDDRDYGRRRRSSDNSSRAIIAIVVCVFIVGVIGLGAWAVLGRGPRAIPDSRWVTHEVPNRYTVRFPGSPSERREEVPGDAMIMHFVEPDRNSVFMAGHSQEDVMAPHRRALPADVILNDACTLGLAQLFKEGGVELKRTSISLDGIPGKEVVMDVPKFNGKIILRCYLVKGRLYMVMVGGRKFEPEHEQVRRFLDSFAILEKDARPPRKVNPSDSPKSKDPQVALVPRDPGATPAVGEPTRPVPVNDTSDPMPPLVEAPKPPRPRPRPLPAVEVKLPLVQPPASRVKMAPLASEKVEVALFSYVADSCVGGGGRFFILHLPKERQLAIFDVNEAKVVKYLPLAGDSVKIAAGQNKLFVAYPNDGIVQRYDLTNFEKETTAPLPIKGTVLAIATGSASARPLLVHYAMGSGALNAAPVTFIDPVSFQELDFGGNGKLTRHHVRDSYHYRASPDGTVFGGWVTSHTQSMSSLILVGTTARAHTGPMAGIVVPGADNILVTGGGLYTSQCAPLAGDNAQPRYRLRIPSQTSSFYISCPGGGGAQHNTGLEGKKGSPVALYMTGNAQPIATLKNMELPVANEAWIRHDFTQDKRVLFVPEAKLIAIIPNSSDRLVLHRLDVDATLEKSGVDYLYVTSPPPVAAFKATPFQYTPNVKSKKATIKLKLEVFPEGMLVQPNGALTWDVPADFADKETVVSLTISDDSGKEILHTFKLLIEERSQASSDSR